MHLDYAVVIATRNRPTALRLSIPRMLSQSRPPAQLIVVDSSDDHVATVEAVKDSVGNHQVELIIRHSAPSSSAQRNFGLTFVTCPVVFFPDDDAIWFPGAAAAQMDVYERDQNGQIAAVCATESSTPPVDWAQHEAGAYQMRPSHRIQQKIATIRSKLENSLFPDPAKLLGRSFWPTTLDLPVWFALEQVVLVEWMTGFRMSFRTHVIRTVEFDESLSRYSLFEDIDASFAAWKHGWVVAALQATVFHFRSPETRGHARRLGAEQLLNKAYIIGKHSPIGHPARRRLCRFAQYKVCQYLFGSQDIYGRERYAGAKAALASLPKLASAPAAEICAAYEAALAAAL